MNDSNPDRTTQFLELLNAHDRSLNLYVHGLVSSHSEAEDILQQTKLLLWKHFGSFELGTNFLAWARKTAFHQILAYRRKKKRDPLPLEDAALEALGEAVTELSTDEHARYHALRACVAKLPVEHRQLIQLRYFQDMEIEDIANQVKRTVGAVYRALSRVRLELMECIEKHDKDQEYA